MEDASASEPQPVRVVHHAEQLRVSTPIYGLELPLPDGSRLNLGESAVMAHLNHRERERVADAHSRPSTLPTWRLEIHGVNFVVEEREHEIVEPDGERWSWTNRTVTDPDPRSLVRWHLAVLALPVPWPLAWENIALDQWDADRQCWTRADLVWDEGGARSRVFEGSGEPELRRLGWWQKLLGEWPAFGVLQRLDTALEYYLESLTDLHDRRLRNSMVSASIAVEVLLGHGLRTELRNRIAQRGARLVAGGPEAWEVYRYLKGWYDDRSALLHEGMETFDYASLVRLHQYLRRAIPSMAYLLKRIGNQGEVTEHIDRASFDESEPLQSILEPGRWWSFLDFAGTLAREVPDKPGTREHPGYWLEPSIEN